MAVSSLISAALAWLAVGVCLCGLDSCEDLGAIFGVVGVPVAPLGLDSFAVALVEGALNSGDDASARLSEIAATL